MIRAAALLAALACLHVRPQTAEACSAPVCWPGAFVPTQGGQVPANLPGIVWQPVLDGGTPGTAANVVLATAAAPSTPLPFTAMPLGTTGDYVLVPDAPLDAGTSYVVSDGNACGDGVGPSISFTTTSIAPLPTSIGTIAASYDRAAIDVGTISGSCSAEVDAAFVDLDLELAADAVPWSDALVFETLVDGEIWRSSASINARVAPGGSWIGRGIDRIYRVCNATDPYVGTGISEGAHEVVMRATLPGSSVVLTSQTVNIDLSCSDGFPQECNDNPALCGDNDPNGCQATRGGSAWAAFLVGALLMLGRRKRCGRRSTNARMLRG